MDELQPPGVEFHRSLIGIEGLNVRVLAEWKVGGIAADRVTEVMEVQADLIGPAGEQRRPQQGGSVAETLEHLEFRMGGLSVVFINDARTCRVWRG